MSGTDLADDDMEDVQVVAAHEADADLLLAAEHARGHARVDAVREPGVALGHGLDDGGRMNAGRRAEGVSTDQRVVDGHLPTDRTRHGFAVGEQLGEVLVLELSEQLHVEQQELHLRTDALADAEAGAVHAIGAELERPDGVLQGETAVVVAVPIDAHVCAGAGDHALRELHEVAHAVGSGVPDRIRGGRGAWPRDRWPRGRAQ